MRFANYAWTLTILMVCYSCQEPDEITDKSITINEVREFYNTLDVGSKDGRHQNTEIQWEAGSYKEVITGDALVFPIVNPSRSYIKVEGTEQLMPLANVTHAFAYRDTNENIHLDFVMELPTEDTEAFTGYIIAGIWGTQEAQHIFTYRHGQLQTVDSDGRAETDCITVDYYECTMVSVGEIVYGDHCDLVRRTIDCTNDTAPSQLAPDDFGNQGGGEGSGSLCPHPDIADLMIPCGEELCEGDDFVKDENGNCINIHFDLDKDGNDMNPCEIRFTIRNPRVALKIYDNSILADNKTQELFGMYSVAPGEVNGVNDCSDAFRHAYFSVLNVRRVGLDYSRKFGEAHECDSPNEKETTMDLHNNEVGFSIALNNPEASVDELTNIIMEQLYAGNLKVLSNLNERNFVTLFTKVISSDICAE